MPPGDSVHAHRGAPPVSVDAKAEGHGDGQADASGHAATGEGNAHDAHPSSSATPAGCENHGGRVHSKASPRSAKAYPDSQPAADPRLGRIRRRTSRQERIRNLIILDVQTLLHRLKAQLPSMIDLFSRHRDREALLAPLRSTVPTAPFDYLAELEPKEQAALVAFLEELEALRWYCRYTDDMPNTAQLRLERFVDQLDGVATSLVRTIRRHSMPMGPETEP